MKNIKFIRRKRLALNELNDNRGKNKNKKMEKVEILHDGQSIDYENYKKLGDYDIRELILNSVVVSH